MKITVAPLPLIEAASALGISPKQLRGLIKRGAPTVRRGKRGRAGAALIDPDAVRAWLAADKTSVVTIGRVHDMIRDIECRMAANTIRFVACQDGPHKVALSANAVALLYQNSTILRHAFGLPFVDGGKIGLPEHLRPYGENSKLPARRAIKG